MTRHIIHNTILYKSNLYKSIIYISILTALLSTVACSHNQASEVPIVRLDRTLADYQSFEQERQQQVLDSLRPEIDAMFAVLGEYDVNTAKLERWSQSQVVDVFQPAVDSVYPTLANLSRQIGAIIERAAADSLRLPRLQFVTVTWGNPRPIVRVDSIILIALNHFIGADYEGYAQTQRFRLIEKSPAMLPYSVAGVLVATQYPMESSSPTLLQWMLYEGAVVEARMRLVPGAKLDMALGYTPEQLKWADEHSREIWQEMALQKVIYSTDPLTIDRYIAPAPQSPVLHAQAPGRIGRYIGYRIVKAYAKSHAVSGLPWLLSPDFYTSPQSLIQSGFDGK